jgi:hypothetical protein
MDKWQQQKEYEERIDLKNQLKRIQCGANPDYLHALDFRNQKSVIDELYKICRKNKTIRTTRLKEYLDKLRGNHE